MSFDIKPFLDTAAEYGVGGGEQYLTDVFFGFEIWNGGSGGGLSVDSFTCIVD